MKRQSLFITMGLLMIVSIFQVPVYTNSNGITPDAITSGSINGIDYSYGLQEFSASGNITRTLNSTVTETLNHTTTRNVSLPLISDFNVRDVYYNLIGIEETATANLTINEWHNNATFQLLVDLVVNQMPLRFDPSNATHGGELENLKIINNYRVAMTTALSLGGDYLGQFPVNTTYILYNHKYLNGTVTSRAFEVLPAYYIVQLTTVLTDVTVTHKEFGWGAVFSYVRHSVEYNVSASAYNVNITDGENFGMGVTMFDGINASYTESIFSVFAFSFINIDSYDIKYANNGSSVDPSMYPRNMLPVVSSSTGQVVEAGYRNVNTRIKSTFQSVVSGFVSKSLNDTDPNNVTATGALSVWGIEFGNVLVAYKEGNNNSKLDVALGDSGLEVTNDQVSYLGLGEAQQTNVVNAYYSSVFLEQNVSSPYIGFDASTSINNTEFIVNTESYGFGDVNGNTGSNSFFWNDPVTNTDGSVEFEFGIQYTNFPVTWYNMTDGTATVDYEDLAYGYHITVDPATGRASMKTSWNYTGISDTTLKAAMNGLSLSLMVKSEFFSLKAFYSATASNETVNATRTRAIAGLVVDNGAGEPPSKINVTGPLQYYLNNGANVSASFDAINIVQIGGGFAAEKVSPFSSQSSETGSNAASGSLVEHLGVSFFYSLDLIVVSFPQWDGNDITWDPEFGVSYQKKAQTTTVPSSSSSTTTTPTSSSTTTTSSTTPTSSSTTTPTTSTTSDTTSAGTSSTSDTVSSTATDTGGVPAPGFELWMAAIALVSIIGFRKRRK